MSVAATAVVALMMGLALYGAACAGMEGVDTTAHETLDLHVLGRKHALSTLSLHIQGRGESSLPTHPPSVVPPFHEVFPRALSSLLTSSRVKRLHLTMRQGRWRTGEWGPAPSNSSPDTLPLGSSLYAEFDATSEQ